MGEVRCLGCGSAIVGDAKFCRDCGLPLSFSLRCEKCGAENPAASRFCGECGTRLKADLPEQPASNRVPEVGLLAERRQLTVVFCDLVGSTALSTRIDPEDFREILEQYRRAVAATAQQYGGFVARHLGDGALIYFGYPYAQEFDAERAIQASISLIRAIGELKTKEPISARIGVATGLVVVGDLSETQGSEKHEVLGETPNLAARLQTLAQPDQVIVADRTKRLAGAVFEYRDLGTHDVKGFEKPVRAWEVVSSEVIATHSQALETTDVLPLIGREEETELLRRRWASAKAGDGRVVLLSGEAGIGKSRIVLSLLQDTAAEPKTLVRLFCSPYHSSSSLYPFITEIERGAQIARHDELEVKRAKLRQLFAALSLEHVANTNLVSEMFYNQPPEEPTRERSPQQRREELLTLLLTRLEALSKAAPLLVIFEDAHWIDATSQDLLDRLLDRISSRPIFLLVTARPEHVPGWAGQPHVTTHPLNRLGEKEVAAFIRQLTKAHQLPEAVIKQIVQRSDGIPLFVDELTRSVIEVEPGSRDADGESSAALTVPATLQASLVARLDRLSLAKDIAQIGATIGRDFPYELLSLVTDVSPSELDNALSQLTQSGLVSRRGEIPNAVYTFKHALVQEAAYQTLLRARRQQLHSKIAQALETRFSETAASRPELLAMHFWEAGQPESAVSYRLQAAQLAASRFANVEAIAHATRGLSELRSLPQDGRRDLLELQFLTTLGPALVATRGYAADETIKAYERARELVNHSGDEKSWDVVLTGLFVAYYNRAAYRAGLDVGHEFLKRADSAVHRCVGHRMLAVSHNSMGRFDESVVQGKAAFSQYDPVRHSDLAWRYAHDIGVAAATHWGIGAWHVGQLALADEMQREALGIAERLGHPNTLGYALYYDGALASLWRQNAESLTYFTSRLRDHAARQGSLQWIAWVAPLEGLALAQQGELVAGIEMIENGIANCDRIKNHAMRPIFLMCLADALRMAGRHERAEQVLVSALAISTETGERWADAEIYRLNSKIALAVGGPQSVDKAKHHLKHSLSIAQEQGSVMFRLRTLLDLHELMGGEGGQTVSRMFDSCLALLSEAADVPEVRRARAIRNKNLA